MKHKVFLQLFLFSLSFISCSNSSDKGKQEALPEIAVGEVMVNRCSVMLSDYASSIEYVELENCDQAQLLRRDFESYPDGRGGWTPAYVHLLSGNKEERGFKKFLYSDGLLCFFNANMDGCAKQICHVFDTNGNFVKSIGLNPSLSDFYCNVTSNFIEEGMLYVEVVANNFLNRKEKARKYLQMYDVNTGELVKSVPSVGNNFTRVDSLHYFVQSADKNVSSGILLDKDLQKTDEIIIARETPTRRSIAAKKKSHFPGGAIEVLTKSYVHKFMNELVVLKESSDTIYKYTLPNGKINCKAAYRLNFADTLLPIMRDMKIDVVSYAENGNLIFMKVKKNKDFPMGEWIELDKESRKSTYYELSAENFNNQVYGGKESAVFVVYNKLTGETRSPEAGNPVWMGGMTNDLDGGFPFWPEMVADGKMFKVVKAVDFIKLSKIYNSEKIKAIASKLTENSNPVVVVATLK